MFLSHSWVKASLHFQFSPALVPVGTLQARFSSLATKCILTEASCSECLLMKLAVMAMASLPRNSLRLKPCSVLRLPSAPSNASNSYCDTTWSDGSTRARQPRAEKRISVLYVRCYITLIFTPQKPISGTSLSKKRKLETLCQFHISYLLPQLYRI